MQLINNFLSSRPCLSGRQAKGEIFTLLKYRFLAALEMTCTTMIILNDI